MADYDAIVVGAGVSGSTAALCMAKAGMSVLVVERGDRPGVKNMTGGRLYGHSLETILPGFAAQAPIERTVIREKISMLTGESCCTLDVSSARFANPASASYTVLRAEFDPWLAGKAEEAGCDVVCPASADELLYDNGKVAGVRAGEDELTADVVLLADGVNSPLGRKAGLKKELAPDMVAVGVKEVLELPGGVINDRFNLEPGEGAAHLFAGEPSQGMVGGGFVYTNKESLSVGLVMSMHTLTASRSRLPDLLQAFRDSKALKPLLSGGKLVEYSAHLVPEGGLRMLPTLAADGVLLLGDAAGFCLNLGYTVRGMDYAIASGMLAAETALEAKNKGDFSAATLAGYTTRLEQSFVLRDLHTHQRAPDFIGHTSRLYQEYPQLAEDLLTGLFTVNGPSTLFIKKALPVLSKAGLFNLLKDAFRGARSI
ncbi:MAG: FAD-dependent oxidoreductase [Betaproteobacteria bacterium]|nr:FAD-dependent oxidoreductase [Desulfovibrionaceae bacterium]MCL1985541.1 FAD-dependent oxidoreductase [Betaproteobacteria bacterium]